jgi:tight adherence protein B
VSSVRAGSTVSLAIEELARTGPEPLREAFARFPGLAVVMGPAPALESIRHRLADATADRVIEVLIVALEVGGGVVANVLEDLAVAVGEDLRTVEEIRTAGLEQRLNARIVFAVPWAVLVLLTARPGAYREFYASPPGTVVTIAAALLSGAALLVVSRLGREPLERRVLAGDGP